MDDVRTCDGITLLIIYVLPRFFKAVPVAADCRRCSYSCGMGIRMGWCFPDRRYRRDRCTFRLPSFLIPDFPFNWETLMIILPYSLSLAVVGFTETMLTHNLLDEMTGQRTDKNKEMRGQGLANFVCRLFWRNGWLRPGG